MAESIRLLTRDRHDTLNRYVFVDLRHARDWLKQAWVKPEDYTLERVAVGDVCRCLKCEGTGYTQTVKTIGIRMTIQEFLEEDKTK